LGEAGHALADRGQRLRIGLSRAVASEEAEIAEDAEVILRHPRPGVADEADAAGAEIGYPRVIIEHLTVRRHGQGVDGEVAARGVGPPVIGEGDHRVAAVGLDVAPQGGDLEAAMADDCGHGAVAEPGRHRLDPGAPEGRRHLVGRAGCRQIDVGDGMPRDRVAHGAAHDAGLGQSRQHGAQGWIVEERGPHVHLTPWPCTISPPLSWAGM